MARRPRKEAWPHGHCVVLQSEMVKSDAFRSLNGSSVRLLLELMTRYFGRNNGDLSLSLDEAVDRLGMGKSTASAAYRELQEKGLLAKTREGCFYRGHATTWRLTFREDEKHAAPTHEWRKWISSKPKRTRKPWGNRKEVAAKKWKSTCDEKRLSGTESEPKDADTVLNPNGCGPRK